ncbi:MAG: barnase inhibitor [Crocinitomicaceae bacterium]|nr:barnase inhibitor [Crocinitomicaceae bacterium]|tara:strand:- start:1470 stop:1760 length:291 start_codon:yes stop_codon:yes gene_type:complete
MKTITIRSQNITDWDSLHTVFAEAFNFPEYYGRNMDAWIDCIDEFTDETTVINMGDCRELRKKAPEIITAILECSAFINYRRLNTGSSTFLIVSIL